MNLSRISETFSRRTKKKRWDDPQASLLPGGISFTSSAAMNLRNKPLKNNKVGNKSHIFKLGVSPAAASTKL